MGENRYRRINALMRSTHLYTGLFLAPWLLVYAASGFCLNHHQWVRETFGVKPPRWEVVREATFPPGRTLPTAPAEQAEAVLRHVGLEGPHNFVGQPDARKMVIHRPSGAGSYRVTWHRDRSLVVVQRQAPFSFYRLLHFLHFRHGFHHRQLAHVVWGVIVNVVTISMWLWVLTGIYIWFRVPKRRALGSLCVVGGSVLFIVLVMLLCL